MRQLVTHEAGQAVQVVAAVGARDLHGVLGHLREHGFPEAEEITAATIPPDFERDARIHRCWRLEPR